jgi:hypothetical protein
MQSDLFGTQELTVSVKALTVNGRQMTEAFFRQIPIGRDLIDWDAGKLREGNLWGVVSYRPPLRDPRAGEYVVWEQGGQLYRYWLESGLPDEARAIIRRLPQLFLGR